MMIKKSRLIEMCRLEFDILKRIGLLIYFFLLPIREGLKVLMVAFAEILHPFDIPLHRTWAKVELKVKFVQLFAQDDWSNSIKTNAHFMIHSL